MKVPNPSTHRRSLVASAFVLALALFGALVMIAWWLQWRTRFGNQYAWDSLDVTVTAAIVRDHFEPVRVLYLEIPDERLLDRVRQALPEFTIQPASERGPPDPKCVNDMLDFPAAARCFIDDRLQLRDYSIPFWGYAIVRATSDACEFHAHAVGFGAHLKVFYVRAGCS